MPDAAHHRYAIITPVRNEARFIARTLESVTSQTEPPDVWIVVDDGSSDSTAHIVAEFRARTPYLRLISLVDTSDERSADRLAWAAEARAFNRGLAELAIADFDFVVKLDADLSFGPEYFADLLQEFDRDPGLGIAGGHCYEMRHGQRVLEWVPEGHVRGATKMYRTACFLEVGGIEPVYGWDTLDELRAQMAGWKTRSFHPGVDHLKPTGSIGGIARGRARMGRGAYLLGYHPLFLLVRTARLAFAPPYLLGGLAFLGGYVRAALERLPRVAQSGEIAYLRAGQMRRLRGAFDASELRSLFRRDAL